MNVSVTSQARWKTSPGEEPQPGRGAEQEQHLRFGSRTLPSALSAPLNLAQLPQTTGPFPGFPGALQASLAPRAAQGLARALWARTGHGRH